ncbi:MAG: hypoxanthine phosphoribosyltransferase [Actinobacteria bacterium]|nr:hypoxanthine phosphoribosyltransferase [Actinomycetota bacterium]
MKTNLGEVLVNENQIKERIDELGAEISKDYEDKNLLVVGLLRGAVVFLADLVRSISTPIEFDFIAVSSYGTATKTSGVVRILKDLDEEIENRHILLVEDMVDTGLTLNYLLKNLRSRRPESLEVCAFLVKQREGQTLPFIKYAGFMIPDHYVVGYGLDYSEKYRNLPYVSVLKSEQNE